MNPSSGSHGFDAYSFFLHFHEFQNSVAQLLNSMNSVNSAGAGPADTFSQEKWRRWEAGWVRNLGHVRVCGQPIIIG